MIESKADSEGGGTASPAKESAKLSISTLLIRNLDEVFAESDGVRRRAALAAVD